MAVAVEVETPPRVLVVEDEPDIAALVAYELTRAGLRVETAHTGQEAIDSIMRRVPDMMILDRMLPGLSGDELLKILRDDPATNTLPVLMLTAKREEQDRIAGLELGVDDYVTKPFSPRELVLRVKAVLRRSREPAVDAGAQLLRAGPLSLNLSSHEVRIGEDDILLTPTEYRLLRALMERQGRTQSRQRLLEKAWDVDARAAGRIQTRTVDMHVRRLRQKLGPLGSWLETVRGFGYRFRPPAAG